MAEFKLGRIKFVYQGAWQSGYSYVVDDVVTNGGRAYICVLNNTSSSTFATDLAGGAGVTKWNLLADGQAWKGNWSTSTYYNINDLVLYGNVVYLCNTAHMSCSASTTITATGFTVSAGVATLTYATTLNGNPPFLVGETITLSGFTPTSTSGTVNLVNTTFTVVTCTSSQLTFALTGTYTVSTLGTVTGTSGLEAEQTYWTTYASNLNWLGAWTTSTRYKANDFISYGGITYVCNTAHVSASTATLGLEANQSFWSSFNPGLNYLGAWVTATRYKLNDIVKYGPDLWICTTPHTSSGLTINTTDFTIFVNGLEFENSWSNTTNYAVGDLVTYGGYTYTAIQNNSGQVPSTSTGYWQIFTTGLVYAGAWVSSTAYRIGQIVTLGGFTYTALADNTNSEPSSSNVNWGQLNAGIRWNAAPSTTYNAVSSVNLVSGAGNGTALFDVTLTGTSYSVVVHAGAGGAGYSNNDTLKILGTNLGGISPANDLTVKVASNSGGVISTVTIVSGYAVTWQSGMSYLVGDAVYYGNSSYICVSLHIGLAGTNDPISDSTGSFWNLLASGADSGVLTTTGDIVYYGNSGATRLPIGTDGQILRVNGSIPSWSYYGLLQNVVYVSPSGSDVTGNSQGLSLDKPWATVLFACKQIEDGYLNTNAGLALKVNKQFMLKEVNNWILTQYSFNVIGTGASGNTFIVGGSSTTSQTTTANMYYGMPITFSTAIVTQIVPGTTYYVNTFSANSFTISTSYKSGSILPITANSISTGTASFVYNQFKAERDAGTIVDAIVFDLTHGGNLYCTTATEAFFATLTSYITTNAGYEMTVWIASLQYLQNTLLPFVLTNTAPGVTYQSIQGLPVNQQAVQNITEVPTANIEVGTISIAQNLLAIITNALTAGTYSGIPQLQRPHTSIYVKTGTYNEYGPMVLPQDTALVGDELRSTIIQAATAQPYLANDRTRTVSALQRIQWLLPAIASNVPVISTSTNSAVQEYLGTNPFSSFTQTVSTNVTLIQTILANGLSALPGAGTSTITYTGGSVTVPNTGTYTLTTPTGFGTTLSNIAYACSGNVTGSTVGYDAGVAQITQNIAFIQTEIAAYMASAYTSVWSGMSSANQGYTLRDVGYLLNSIIYDMTYGGNTQSEIDGLAYYSLGSASITSGFQAATVGMLTRIQTIIPYIVTANTGGWTKTSGNTASQVTTGTAGQTNAGVYAAALVGLVINWVNGTNGTGNSFSSNPVGTIRPCYSWVPSSNLSAFNNIQANKVAIQSWVKNWVSTNYGSVVSNLALTYRDAGTIVDALSYDLLLGSNYYSMISGRAFYRLVSSAETLVGGPELAVTQQSINYIGTQVAGYAAGSPIGASGSTINIANSATVGSIVNNNTLLQGILANGLTYSPVFGNPNSTIISQTTLGSVTNNSTTGISYSTTTVALPAGTAIVITRTSSGTAITGNLTIGGTAISAIGSTISAIYYTGATSTATTATLYASYQNALSSTNPLTIGGTTTTGATFTISITTPNIGTFTTTTPTGYNTSSLTNTAYSITGLGVSGYTGNTTGDTTGYGYGAANIAANITFLQTEIANYLNGYTGSGFSWNGLTAEYQGKSLRDLGYILQSIQYDIIYGGNTQSQIQGIGYYSLGVASLTPASTLAASVAALTRLQTIIPNIINGNTTWSKTSGNNATQTVVTSGTYTNAATYAQALIGNIINWVNGTNGTGSSLSTGIGLSGTVLPCTTWVSAPVLTAFNAIQAQRSYLQTQIQTFVATQYPNNVTNLALTYRDAGTVIDALSYDMLLGSNYFTLVSGRSFYKYVTSAQNLVSPTELSATQSATQYIAYYISALATQAGTLPAQTGDFGNPAAVNLVINNTAIIQNMFANGLTITPGVQNNTNYGTTLGIVQEPAFNIPRVTGYNTYYLVGFGTAVTQIQNNYQFIKDEIINYLNDTLSGTTWQSYGVTNQAETVRDLSNILDALQYDLTYGCNDQSLICGRAYYSLNSPLIVAPYLTGVQSALNRLLAIIGSIVRGSAVSASVGNSTTQNGISTDAGANASAFVQARVSDIIYWLTYGIPNPTTGTTTGTISGSTLTVASGTGLAIGQCITGTTLTTTATAVNGSTGAVTLLQTTGLASGMAITFTTAYGYSGQSAFGGLTTTTYTINAVSGNTVTLYQYGTTTAPSLTTATGQMTVTAGVAPGTYITAGSGTSWTVSVSQTIVTTTTITGTFIITPVVSGAFNFATPLNQLSFNAIQAQATLIQNDAQAWVTRFFQNEGPSLPLTNRDAGYVVTALSYDVLFGSNFYSIINGRAYNRLIPLVAALQQNYADSTYGAIGFIGQKIKVIAAAGFVAQTQTTIDDMVAQILGQPTNNTLFVGSINGTQLTINSISAGIIIPGMVLSGTGIQTGTSIISGATTTITGAYISSNTGVFSLATPLITAPVVGQQITISGTFSAGSIVGYVSGTIYYVIGNPTTSAFQLSTTQNGTPVTTTTGGSSGSPITGITITASPTQWLLNYSASVSSTTTSIQNVIPTTNYITLGTTTGMVPGLSVTISGASIGNLIAGTYYIKQVLSTTQLTLSTSYNGPVLSITAANTLSNVSITGINGQFSFNAVSVALGVGQPVTISGSNVGTGSIVGYSNPTTYYIVGTPTATSFVLSASINGSPITTTAGTPSGWTIKVGYTGAMIATVYGIYGGLALTTNVTGLSTNIPVTAVTTSTNLITLSSDAGIYINMPIVFTGLPSTINTTAIATTGSTTNTITLAATASSLGIVAGQQVYFTGVMLGTVVFNQIYYVINPTSNTIQISNTLGGSAVSLTSTTQITGVTITSTSGVFACTALGSIPKVGQAVTINGTLSTGTINGSAIVNQTFYIIGSPTTTAFQLSATVAGQPIVTTTTGSTITGATFNLNAAMNVFVNAAGGLVNGDTYWVNSVTQGTYPASGTTITITNNYKSGTAFTITNSLTGLTAYASVGLYTNQGIAYKIVNGMSQVWGNPTNSYQSYPGYNNTLSTITGAELLRINKTFLATEAAVWPQTNYGSVVTTTNSNGTITTSTPHNLFVGDPVQFGLTGTIFDSNILTNTVYWVLTTPTSTTFTVSVVQPGSGTQSTLGLVGGSGSMSVNYYIIVSKATRDASYHIDALHHDVTLTGNYKSTRYAQVYLSAVTGSQYTNLIHVRNGTGVRNMTLNGMQGALTIPNALGTKRPTGGTYTSLDPGFGPNDSSVWEFIRSCYVQNVTTFGNGCVGMKIDAALHNGGNRSMLANDYTQVLSDGIGIWCTGHGALTECVSVFSYYGYSGYMAEYGGRIRATNGNSSYGTYGVIAEGVDSYETPIYANLNNRANPAYITNVVTDGTNAILRIEYENAGSAYSNYNPSISGAGYNAFAIGDEIRDFAVFETRLVDMNNGQGVGGSNYLTISNTAQSGTVGQITIANSDTNLSSAYIGMRIFLTGGTGVGQYANILNYTASSKIVNVYRSNFVPLTITTNTTSVFTVSNTNTMYANQPIYLGANIGNLTYSTVYYVVGSSLSANGTTFSVSTSSGGAASTLSATSATPAVMSTSTIIGTTLTVGTLASGTIYVGMLLTGNGVAANTYISANISGSSNGSTWTVTVSQNISNTTITGTISVQVYEAGWDAAVPGATIANVLDATTTYIIEPLITYTSPGFTSTATTIPSAQYGSVAYGAGNFVTAANPGTVTSYSTNGTTWTAGGVLPSSTNWNVVYGGGQGATATAVIGGLNGSGCVLQPIIGTGANYGQIVGITVVQGGNNYSSPPTIVITDSTGQGAQAVAEILNGSVTNVYMNITGSLYTSPTVTAITSELSSITPVTWGQNYFTNPTVVISPPVASTAWTSSGTATANAYYYYVDVTVVPNVTNYYQAQSAGTFSTTAPTFTNQYYGKSGSSATGIGASGTYGVTLVYAGSLPAATANLTNNGISSFTVTQAGFGYTSVPTVTIIDQYAAFLAISTSTNATAYNPVSSISATYSVSSTLGNAWSSGTSTGQTTLNSVAYGNNYYIAVGGSGSAVAISLYNATSLASASWVNQSSYIPSNSSGYTVVAYGGGVFCAIGGTLTSWMRSDPTTWYVGGTLPSKTWVSLTYGNGRFIALASDGTVYYTVNWQPSAWTSSPNITNNTWVAANNNPLNAIGITTWKNISYGEGLFTAISSAPAMTVTATSSSGATLSSTTGLAVGAAFTPTAVTQTTTASSTSHATASTTGIIGNGAASPGAGVVFTPTGTITGAFQIGMILTSSGTITAGTTILGVNGVTFTGTISTTTLTVTGTPTGVISVGMAITGTSVTAGTYIVAYGSGSGGAGSYTLNQSATGTPTTGTSYSVSVSQVTTSATLTGTLDQVQIGSSSGMAVNESIVFAGTTGGGITANTVYYISRIVNSTTISIATTPNSTSNLTLTNLGTPPASVTAGSYLGGLVSGTTYYIASVNSGTGVITIADTQQHAIANTNLISLTTATGSWTAIAGSVGSAYNYCATSWSGVDWAMQVMPATSSWQAVAFGNPTNTTLGSNPTWVVVSKTNSTTAALIQTGATPLGRVKVTSNAIAEVRMIEPGSGFARGNVSATTLSTNVITVDNTVNLYANQQIVFNGTSAGGLSTNVYYYVVNGSITSTSFQVSTSYGGVAIPLTTANITGITYFASPIATITDPNHVNSAPLVPRIGNGVLGNPTFTNRGVGNTTATASVTGDGYGDFYQTGSYINVSGLYQIPTAGCNVTFSSITGSNQWYKLVQVTNVLGIAGNYTATFQINPSMSTLLAPIHNTLITTRLLYSNSRLTGHDFLYIGTGGFTSTNYPNVDPTKAVTANQTLATGGGRVFFTSTDQDGNFNVGNLFGVQQSTGTASLNASAFNLSGLQSLTLGSVSLGVNSATITQFSTDQYFTANSDSIVPTQKAVKAYITSQIGGGQSSLNVNTITAGQVYIAGNSISTTTGNQIYVSSKMLFTGGIDGAPVALQFFGQR